MQSQYQALQVVQIHEKPFREIEDLPGTIRHVSTPGVLGTDSPPILRGRVAFTDSRRSPAFTFKAGHEPYQASALRFRLNGK